MPLHLAEARHESAHHQCHDDDDHHHQSLSQEGCWGTTYDFAISFPQLPCSPLLSETCQMSCLSIQ